jgi:hypothetical protein
MGSLTISNKMLDRYFGYLKNLDNDTKKHLIIKLTKSLETPPKKEIDLKSLYVAWDDKRDSDEIISDIRSSRVDKTDTLAFE